MMNSIMAEQSAIGCLLMDGNLMAHAGELNAGDFFQPECRTIFEALHKLFLVGRPIDPVTVLHELSSDHAGYKEYLVRLAEITPTTAHFGEYVAIVTENARRTRAQQAAVHVVSLLQEGAPLHECQEEAFHLAQALSASKGGCVSAAEGFALVLDSLDKPRRYIQTGFGHLDRYILFDRGDYMVIGGRPSSGKTAFSLQIVLNMAREYTVCYFSLETSARKIYERLLACYATTPFDEINRGMVKDKARLETKQKSFSQLKLHVIDAAGWNVAQMQAKALERRAEVIVVDYIGLVSGQGKTIYERVTNVSRDLHIMAQRGKIAVVALSQLNRAGDGEPDMTSLRESGQIEQDADAILLLNIPGQKSKKQVSQRKLSIAKNKTGRIGNIQLDFNGNFQKFVEVIEREERPF